jgi:hypothetical protein
MRDRALITTGVVGGALAAICCATPLLAVNFNQNCACNRVPMTETGPRSRLYAGFVMY